MSAFVIFPSEFTTCSTEDTSMFSTVSASFLATFLPVSPSSIFIKSMSSMRRESTVKFVMCVSMNLLFSYIFYLNNTRV